MTATVKIPYVEWRDGRPRFKPGKALRDAGWKPKDLKHKDGTWYSEGEALDWARAFQKARVEPQTANMVSMPHIRPQGSYTVARLLQDWRASPRVMELAPATRDDYRKKARVIETHAPDIWAAEVNALDHVICAGLYEELWEERGLATARGAMVVLGLAIKWGMRRRPEIELRSNPARDLDMKMPKPRARFITPDEFSALVTAAEALQRVDVADMLFCGVWTGQRQGDRIALTRNSISNGRFVVRQAKTGAIVNPPIAPAYKKRLDAAARRLKAAGIISPYAHIDEHTGKQWSRWTYRNLFKLVRVEACKTMPSCATIMEKDLRATAITWMALAGSTLAQICAVSGHSLQGASIILKHYLALHPDMATTAIGNMVDWYEAGAKLDQLV